MSKRSPLSLAIPFSTASGSGLSTVSCKTVVELASELRNRDYITITGSQTVLFRSDISDSRSINSRVAMF